MKQVFKYFLAVGIFFLILGISEAIYIYNNRPEVIQAYYLMLAKREASNNNTNKSLYFIKKASDSAIHFTAKRYPDLVPKKYLVELPALNERSEFSQSYLNYVKTVDINHFLSQKKIDLGRIIYHLALIAYRNGQEELTPKLLQIAVYIKPNLVHYHLELANYYLKKGEIQKTDAAITYCYHFEFPKSFCENYYKNNISTNTPDQVGFLEDALKKDYQNYIY